MTFEELVDEAVAVVYGRVADVRGQWTADRRSIDSLVTSNRCATSRAISARRVVMQLPGGEAGGMINVIPGAPVLRHGELVVLFLTARGPAIPTALGMGQGVFRVVRDPRSGATLVTPPPLKGSVAGRIVRGAAERRALTLDAFAATVQSLGAAR